MTLNEIAYNILNTMRGGRTNDDEHISLEQIRFQVNYYRAKFARQDIQRNGNITRQYEQSLGCVELEEVTEVHGFELPCAIWKTKQPIPRTLLLNSGDAITYVGRVDGRDPFNMVTPASIPYLMHEKYTAHKPKAWMIEDYMYFINVEDIEKITIRGIFEDPRDVSRFTTCDGASCYSNDMEYPLPMHMVDLITEEVASQEAKLLATTKNDVTTDREQN